MDSVFCMHASGLFLGQKSSSFVLQGTSLSSDVVKKNLELSGLRGAISAKII